MKIYYAHAMCIYGTDDEENEIQQIRQNFPDHSIVDPGTYANNPEKRRDSMEYCKKLVSGCDKLVFTRLLGKITAGVGIEINHVLESGKIVYELKNKKTKQKDELKTKISSMSTDDVQMLLRVLSDGKSSSVQTMRSRESEVVGNMLETFQAERSS